MKNKKDCKEFIRRTLAALDAYEKNLPAGEQSYDRTLFMNACLGLLILPKEEYYKTLPKVSAAEWGFPVEKISTCGDTDIPSVIRHLRNAIAHNRIDFECNDGPTVPIGDITFVDKCKDDKENFRVVVDFNTFKNFIMKFARYIKRIK